MCITSGGSLGRTGSAEAADDEDERRDSDDYEYDSDEHLFLL